MSLRTSNPENLKNAKIAGAITCILIPVFIFLVTNITRFPAFFASVEFTETRLTAESFAQQGVLNLSGSAHSSFFQTPFLLFVLVSVTGLSTPLAAVCLIIFYFFLIGFLGVYVSQVICSKATEKTAFVAYLATFSLISAASLMETNIPYRYIGSLILPLAGFFLIKQTVQSKSSFTVFLLLIVAITLGDPVSSLLMIPLFLLYAFYTRDFILGMLTTGIPLSYIAFTGQLYLLSWKSYFVSAWSGIGTFAQELYVGKFTPRVLPWHRALSITSDDNSVATIGFLSLILLAVLLSLLSLTLLRRKNNRILYRNKGDSFVRAATIYVAVLLCAVFVVYIGISVTPESPFSDTRTTVIGYLSFFIIFLFASKALFHSVNTKKLLVIAIVCLLVLSSLRVVYRAYPKSGSDPVLAVESNQMDLMAVGYGYQFLASHYVNGSLVRDYKTGVSDLSFIVEKPSRQYQLSASTVNLKGDMLLLDLNGLKYPSIYIPSDVYQAAFDASLNESVVYNNGAIIICTP